MIVKKRKRSACTYTLDGIINREGRGGGGAYIRNNIFVSKSMGLYPGVKTGGGGALTWDFTVINLKKNQNFTGNIIVIPQTHNGEVVD